MTIPPFSFELLGNNFTLELACGGLDLGAVHSRYSLQSDTYALNVSGVAVSCGGRLDLRDKKGRQTAAKLGLGLGSSAMEAALQLINGPGYHGLASAAELTQILLALNISRIDITGLPWYDEALADLVKDFLRSDIVVHGLEKGLESALTSLVDANLTAVLRQVDNIMLPYIDPPPPPPPPPVPPGMLDLRDDPLVADISWLLTDFMGVSGNRSLNRIVDAITNHGALSFNSSRTNSTSSSVSFDLADLANVTVGIKSMTIDGLDTWDRLEAFVPVNAVTLVTRARLAHLALNATLFVRVLPNGGTVSGGELYEEASVVFAARDPAIDIVAQAALWEDHHITGNAWTNRACILGRIYSLNFTRFSLNMTLEALAIHSHGGGGGANAEESDIDTAIDDLLELLLGQYAEFLPAFFNGVVGGPVVEELNVELDRVVHNGTCAYTPLQTTDLRYFAWAFGWALLLWAVMSFFLVRARRRLGQTRGTEYAALLVGGSEASDATAPLALHSKVGACARYGIPLVILMTVALFAVSNASDGAVVLVKYKTNNTSTALPPTFDFTLANSVHDMWQAGVYALSLLICVASGAWPYLKLLLMLSAWLCPPRLLSIRGREIFLQVLDALGKWSLIDSYVLVMMIVAFHFYVPLQDGSVAEVVVLPQFGFFGFLLATVISLIVTHVMLHFHRSSTGEAISSSSSSKHQRLCEHAFDHGGRMVALNRAGRWGVQLLLWGAFAAIATGSVVTSFRFDFRGLAGWALAQLGQPVGSNYSLVDLGAEMDAAADAPGDPGLLVIQICFFLFALVIPLAHLALLSYLWHARLSTSAQRALFTAAEVLNAWSALDVFVVSLIVALLEIRQFAAFIVGDDCDPINSFLANSTKWDKALHGDDTCFDVIATLEPGCWILFGASAVWLFAAQLVMRLCHRALHERDDRGGGSGGSSGGGGRSHYNSGPYKINVAGGKGQKRASCCLPNGFASLVPCFFTDLGYRA